MKPEELKNIAPILASLQEKGTGFTVSETYFDSVESNFENNFKPISLPKKAGFKAKENYFDLVEDTIFSKLHLETEQKLEVPDNYFDTLEDKVMARLAKQKKTKIFNIKKYWIPISIVASLVLFFSVYTLETNKKNKEIAEVIQWVESGNLDLDSYEISEYLNPDIATLEFENTINKTSLENYLNEEISEEFFYN